MIMGLGCADGGGEAGGVKEVRCVMFPGIFTSPRAVAAPAPAPSPRPARTRYPHEVIALAATPARGRAGGTGLPGWGARARGQRAFPLVRVGGQNERVQVAMLGPLEVLDDAGSVREVSG